jgi:hypothetical protein
MFAPSIKDILLPSFLKRVRNVDGLKAFLTLWQRDL